MSRAPRSSPRQQRRPLHCTGLSAQWCPRCGTCTCRQQDDGMGRTMNDRDCPLHSAESAHGEPRP